MQFLSFTLLHSTLPSARSFFFLLGKKIVSLQYLSVSGAVRTALLYRFIKLVDFVKSFHSLQLAPKNEQPKNTKSFLHVSASVLSWLLYISITFSKWQWINPGKCVTSPFHTLNQQLQNHIAHREKLIEEIDFQSLYAPNLNTSSEKTLKGHTRQTVTIIFQRLFMYFKNHKWLCVSLSNTRSLMNKLFPSRVSVVFLL